MIVITNIKIFILFDINFNTCLSVLFVTTECLIWNMYEIIHMLTTYRFVYSLLHNYFKGFGFQLLTVIYITFRYEETSKISGLLIHVFPFQKLKSGLLCSVCQFNYLNFLIDGYSCVFKGSILYDTLTIKPYLPT